MSRKLKMETKLKEYLANNGMRQEYLANKLKLTPHTIHNIVAGKSEPSLKTAVAIEDFTKGYIKPRDMIVPTKIRKKYEKKTPTTEPGHQEIN
jgi:DNA-binding XRE family transcriptional regulator